MATIPDEKVQEIRDRVDIVDLIGRYVELRRAGRNYKGLCPFHQERGPSFNVNPERKGYKCFGCGAGGDAIRFVMEIEGKSFPETLRKLGELYGVVLPVAARREGGGGGAEREHEKDEAYAALRVAADLYERLLWQDPVGAPAREYLERRDLDPGTVRQFRLGYAPAPSEGGWDTLSRALHQAGISPNLTQKLGLCGKSERSGNLYDKFRGRLMFPIITVGGDVVAFSGRVIPPHDAPDADGQSPPKYVNSAESLLFTKGKTLFALANARPAIRQSRRALLVEGNIDVVKLHQWKHAQAVAPLGTSLTSDQARLLSRFAEEVVMCFDGDSAGKKAAWSALPLLLEAELDVSMVLLPEGEDPDSIGAERFAALLDRAKPALEEMMVRIAAKAGAAAHARARGLDRLLPLIAKVRRESTRELLIDRAADLFGFPPNRVESAVRNAAAAASSGPSGGRPTTETRHFDSISGGPVTLSAAVRSLPPLPAGQAQLTMLLVDVPHLAAVAERTGAAAFITDPRLAPIAQAILDGAKAGENPSMPELLERVQPPEAQRMVYAKVFAGRYRPGGDDAAFDPQTVLLSLVHRCREEALDREIRDIDRQIAAAQDQGYPEQASALAQQRLVKRREQAALMRQQQVPATPSRSEN